MGPTETRWSRVNSNLCRQHSEREDNAKGLISDGSHCYVLICWDASRYKHETSSNMHRDAPIKSDYVSIPGIYTFTMLLFWVGCGEQQYKPLLCQLSKHLNPVRKSKVFDSLRWPVQGLSLTLHRKQYILTYGHDSIPTTHSLRRHSLLIWRFLPSRKT